METRGSRTDRERGIDDGKVDQLCIESTSSTRYYGGQTKYRGVTGHGILCSGSRSRKTRPSARANNDGEASIVLQVIESSLPSDASSTRSLLLHLFASPAPFFPSIHPSPLFSKLLLPFVSYFSYRHSSRLDLCPCFLRSRKFHETFLHLERDFLRKSAPSVSTFFVLLYGYYLGSFFI